MPVYTVHAPVMSEGVSAADKFTFVRDGFHTWAAVLGPVWLLAHRLWLAFLGWVVVSSMVAIALKVMGAEAEAILVADTLVALLLGLEAASLQRWTLSRGKWRQVDLVVGDDEEAAERRFFDRWTAKQNGSGFDPATIDRGAPPPTRNIPGQPFSKPPSSAQNEIIGLFPQPGGSR